MALGADGNGSDTTLRDVERVAQLDPDTKETQEIGEPARDPNVVGFDGPDDPENPLNWPQKRKSVTTIVVSSLTFLSTTTSTMVAPGVSDIMKSFHSDDQIIATFITTIFLVGYIFGPMVIAPLSEMYGRRVMYVSCGALFVVWNVACALANNIGSLLVFRIFAGIAGSCPLTLGASSIGEVYAPEHRGAAMAAWALGPMLGPAIAPIVGGYLTPAAGWRWDFWLLAIVCAVPTILAFFFLKESYPYVILKRKTERLRKETGNNNLRSALDTGRTVRDLFAFSIVRPLKMLLFSPIVFLLSLYTAVVYSYMYIALTIFPQLFSTQYGFRGGALGLADLGLGVGALAGLLIAALSDRVYDKLKNANGGKHKPEYRIPVTIIGAVLVPIGLFWYGWSAEAKTHWIMPIIGSAFLNAGMIVIFIPLSTYIVESFTIYSASAMATNTMCRCVFGAFLPLAGPAMYDALGYGWGTSVLGFIAVAFLPVPILLYRYGQRIRESKRFQVEF